MKGKHRDSCDLPSNCKMSWCSFLKMKLFQTGPLTSHAASGCIRLGIIPDLHWANSLERNPASPKPQAASGSGSDGQGATNSTMGQKLTCAMVKSLRGHGRRPLNKNLSHMSKLLLS